MASCYIVSNNVTSNVIFVVNYIPEYCVEAQTKRVIGENNQCAIFVGWNYSNVCIQNIRGSIEADNSFLINILSDQLYT